MPDTLTSKKRGVETSLQEVVVEAESQMQTKEKSIFRPTSRQKNAATGGIDLVTYMALPNVYVDMQDNSLRTMNGENVTMFIDWRVVSADEVEQLRPQDVSRVEVYDNPADPRFMGVRHAINYVMRRYDSGGYTKLNAFQGFVYDFGRYSINSKFVYKKMSYDFAVGDNYTNTDGNLSYTNSCYSFGDGEVERKQSPVPSKQKSNKTFLTFRALYSNKNIVIQNNLGINFGPQRTTTDHYLIETDYHGEQIDETLQRSKGNLISPVWTGAYQFFLPRKWSLMVAPKLSYMHNTSDYSYITSDPSIINNVVEDAWKGSLNVRGQKTVGKHSYYAALYGEMTHDRLDYSGTTPTEILMRNQIYSVSSGSNLNFGKLGLNLNVMLQGSRYDYNSVRRNYLYPKFYAEGNYMFNPKHKLSLSGELSRWTVPLSQQSPNMLIQNNLDAICGNDNLHNFNVTSLNIQYTVFPVKNISGTLFASYQYQDKSVYSIYKPTNYEGHEYMVRYLENGGYSNDFNYGISVSVRALGNSLNIFGKFDGTYRSYKGMGLQDGNYFRVMMTANYFIGNFRFQANFTSKTRAVMTDSYTTTPATYVLSAGDTVSKSTNYILMETL